MWIYDLANENRWCLYSLLRVGLVFHESLEPMDAEVNTLESAALW